MMEVRRLIFAFNSALSEVIEQSGHVDDIQGSDDNNNDTRNSIRSPKVVSIDSAAVQLPTTVKRFTDSQVNSRRASMPSIHY